MADQMRMIEDCIVYSYRLTGQSESLMWLKWDNLESSFTAQQWSFWDRPEM